MPTARKVLSSEQNSYSALLIQLTTATLYCIGMDKEMNAVKDTLRRVADWLDVMSHCIKKWQANTTPAAFNLLNEGFYFLFGPDKYNLYAVVFASSVAFS